MMGFGGNCGEVFWKHVLSLPGLYTGEGWLAVVYILNLSPVMFALDFFACFSSLK